MSTKKQFRANTRPTVACFPVLSLVLLNMFSTAIATEYYVSPTGNDANDGMSLTAPFATVSKGISKLQAGDTLYLRGGDHYVSKQIEMYTTKGTAERPITVT